ncbi:hypothetical protein AB0B50_34255 [Streptomyces sp. NPDC041068]|uniref:hypothetical protein n=1 Tax=Streptomyces sp. NPDC041068 TaxID=3155130 RepID=UPI0033C4DC21
MTKSVSAVNAGFELDLGKTADDIAWGRRVVFEVPGRRDSIATMRRLLDALRVLVETERPHTGSDARRERDYQNAQRTLRTIGKTVDLPEDLGGPNRVVAWTQCKHVAEITALFRAMHIARVRRGE